MSAPHAQLERPTGRELRTDARAATSIRSLRNVRDMILAPHGQA